MNLIMKTPLFELGSFFSLVLSLVVVSADVYAHVKGYDYERTRLKKDPYD
jgi:hypothetical protein